jgi:capsule polysaccharide export protein KpsE/RkpR
MCWKPSPSFEVFDSEEASDVALKLCFKIAEALEAKDTDAFVVQLLERVNELLAENADLQKQLEAKHEELLDAARELQRRSEPDDER